MVTSGSGGSRADLVPSHHQVAAHRGHVDLVTVGKGAHDLPLCGLVDGAEPPIDLFEASPFLLQRRGGQTPYLAIVAKLDLLGSGDDLLECKPPKARPTRPVVGGRVDGERQRPAPEQGIGVSESVPVAIVEGETDEASRLAVFKAPRSLVERDDVKPGLLHLVEHGIQELRRDFQDAVRRERFRWRGPHMVQRENHAGALRVGASRRWARE